MSEIKILLRRLLVVWLLLAVPAQVMAVVMPSNAANLANVAVLQQHDCHNDHVDPTQQIDPQPAANHAKCGGGCCIGWMAAVSVIASMPASGTEKTVLLPPHFVGFVSETPQRPPSLYSA